jgi:hypothetical protein
MHSLYRRSTSRRSPLARASSACFCNGGRAGRCADRIHGSTVEEIAPPIHIIAIGRLRTDQRTKHYVARRLAEGHSKLDAIRALKRYLAREVFTLITQGRREINATRIAA